MGRRRRKGLERKIALERIAVLFELAEKEGLKGNLRRSDRYVRLARRIGMRYNVPLPRQYKRRYCKRCLSYLLPSVTCTVRIRRSRVIVTCANCGAVSRFLHVMETKERRLNKR